MFKTICVFFAVAAGLSAAAGDVVMTLNGKPAAAGDYKPADVQALTLDNGLLAITFGPDGSATSLVKNGQELIHNLNGIVPRDTDAHRSWYIDYSGGGGRLIADVIRVVQVSPAMAHIAVIDNGENNRFPLEHHILLRKGESGLYGYVICRNPNNRRLGGEMRTMYRLDRNIFDWAYVSERTGQQPRYGELVKYKQVQDETWEMPDGSIYQKYDYSAYFSETPMFGHYGHGFGVFFMPVSTEYYSAGPLHQELMVHQDALILNYFQGSHYGGGGGDNFKDGVKLFGPWFTYVNTGDNAAVIADAKKKVAVEQSRWPYRWMNEPLYPLDRTTVTGQLKIDKGGSAANAMVMLAKPGVDVYKQGGDFIFYRKADASGRFTLPAVRPGTYALYAYATQGQVTAQLEKDDVVVTGPKLNLGAVEWKTPGYKTFLWQIGKADRMSGEYKYGDELRNIKWIGMVPADLTFTIGTSKEREDWYFAQGKPGNWDVAFTTAKPYTGTAHLTVAIAGASNAPHVTISVNGKEIKSLAYQNDAATYRAALRSAVYRLEDIGFPAELLTPGANTIRFGMTAVGRNGGLMYDTIKLEVE
jgi:rhamnogalacturonan endolyase